MHFTGKDFEETVINRLLNVYKNLKVVRATTSEDTYKGVDLTINALAVDLTINSKKRWCSQKFTVTPVVTVQFRYANGKCRFEKPVLVFCLHADLSLLESACKTTEAIQKFISNAERCLKIMNRRAVKPEGLDSLPAYDHVIWRGKDGGTIRSF